MSRYHDFVCASGSIMEYEYSKQKEKKMNCVECEHPCCNCDKMVDSHHILCDDCRKEIEQYYYELTKKGEEHHAKTKKA